MPARLEERSAGKGNQRVPVVVTMTAEEQATIDGRKIARFLNEKTGLEAGVVLTDETILHPIASGTRCIITGVFVSLNTPSDTVDAEFVLTENANGSGTVTPITIKLHLETPSTPSGIYPQQYDFRTPIVVDYTMGGAITGRLKTNDAGAEVTVSYSGYWETILPDVDLDA